MKNKGSKLMLVVCLTGLFTGACESWLDVQPKSEVKSDLLFETENGFKDALMGVYTLMGSSSAYGLEMTVGFNEVIGQQYDIPPTATTYYDLSLYRYTESAPKVRIDQMWEALYNVVANINNILANLEKHKSVLHPTNYAIIKGECLGLRAFVHFDILRLFGYGDLGKHPEHLDLLSIPYVRTYSKYITPQSRVSEVLNFIHEDLVAAEELLTYYDPWGVTPKDEGYLLPNEDEFYTNRRRRFNYFAVKATQARLYLWEGHYPQALAAAREVIGNGATFPWVNEANIAHSLPYKRDLTFSTEHVFSLYVADLYNKVKSYIMPAAGSNSLYVTLKRGNEMYEVGSGVGASDYRYMYLTETGDDNIYFVKFMHPEDYAYPNNMPLIRKTEMYYIAAECLNETGQATDREEAVSLLNTVRQRRAIVSSLPGGLTKERVMEEITKEYRKELIGEGQMFYYYKRLGYGQVPNSIRPAGTQVYVIPMPDVEKEFGDRK